MAALNSLPNEILSLISSHLDRPRDLLYLSLASRRLADFAKLDGWKALLKGRFGVSGLDADARNSVHGFDYSVSQLEPQRFHCQIPRTMQ